MRDADGPRPDPRPTLSTIIFKDTNPKWGMRTCLAAEHNIRLIRQSLTASPSSDDPWPQSSEHEVRGSSTFSLAQRLHPVHVLAHEQ